MRRLAYYTIGVSMITAMANREMGGEDDDGIPYYDKLPEWLKSRYFVVMIPGTEGNYVSIPLPYGYNVLQVLGQGIAAETEYRVLSTRETSPTADWTLNSIAATFESFNPLGGEASPWQLISPTILDPAVQVWRTATGPASVYTLRATRSRNPTRQTRTRRS